jgi:tetratricopeptide (TPR) repeat protein
LRARDDDGALADFQESLKIRRELAAQGPADTQAQRDVSLSLSWIGEVKLQSGDGAGALAAYQKGLEIAHKLAAQHQENFQLQGDFIIALGKIAFASLFTKKFSDALHRSDEAIAMAPDQLWLYNNRAHALMQLGREDEARKVYLEHRGKSVGDGRTWEQAIKDDFAEIRKAGIKNRLMDEITAAFAKPSKPPAKLGVNPGAKDSAR